MGADAQHHSLSVPSSFTAEFALALAVSVVSGVHAAVTEQHHHSA